MDSYTTDSMVNLQMDYKNKPIEEWGGNECYQWALEAHKTLQLPMEAWLGHQFQLISGQDLLKYKSKDFRRLAGLEAGTKLCRLFRNYSQFHNTNKETLYNSNYLSPDQVSPYWTVSPAESPMYGQMCPAPSSSPYYPSSPGFNDYSSDQLCPTELEDQFEMTDDQYLTSHHFSQDSSDLEQMLYEMELSPGDLRSTDELVSYLPQETSLSNPIDQETLQARWQSYSQEAFMSEPENSGGSFQDTLGAVGPTSSSMDPALEKITTGKRGKRLRHPKSWEFLLRLLLCPSSNPSLIKWEDKVNGIFRLVNKDEIAQRWGSRTEKHKTEPLSYENFARVLRFHYRSGRLQAVSEKHLVYKFGAEIMNQVLMNERI